MFPGTDIGRDLGVRQGYDTGWPAWPLREYMRQKGRNIAGVGGPEMKKSPPRINAEAMGSMRFWGYAYAFLAFLPKMVPKPSMTRMIARTTIAMAKISWNQSPQAARPPLSFLKMVMTREHRVAQSMNTMGM